MAVPKRKTSKARRDKRRTHQKLKSTSPTSCQKCGEAKLPHHICPNCGSYKNRVIFKGTST